MASFTVFHELFETYPSYNFCFDIFQTSMSVLVLHVKMEEHAQMMSTGTRVPASQASSVTRVKQVS